MTESPYAKDLGDREPLAAIRDSIGQIVSLTRDWTPDHFEQSYAPGKWTAGQLLTHLSQTEMGFGYRVRMAVTKPHYSAQSWDQDEWMAVERRLPGHDARDAFVAMARMNLLFFESLSADQRQITLTHPEFGTLTVDWIIRHLAGHHIHHLHQLASTA